MAVYANECRHISRGDSPPACKGNAFGSTCRRCGAALCSFHIGADNGNCFTHWPLPDSPDFHYPPKDEQHA